MGRLPPGGNGKSSPFIVAREGIPTLATAEHAHHIVEIIEAAYRTGETGQTRVVMFTSGASA